MTVEIRMICAPEEADAAEKALRSAFVLSGFRRYPARSGGVRIYCAGAPRNPRKAKKTAPVEIDHSRIDDLNLKLAPIAGKNHMLLIASVPAPGYVGFLNAHRLNDRIQQAIRACVDEDVQDVYLRIDQSYKPSNPGLVVYNPGRSTQQQFYIDEEPEDYR